MSFHDDLSSLWKRVGSHGVMTLSSCADDRVTSRPVSVVVIDGRFYFQTDESYLKFKQICANPNAALCHKSFSIEGACKIIGSPLDEKNRFFTESYKKYFYGSYKMYSSLPSERLLEITPALIYSWSYKLTKPYMEYWDFKNQSYIRKDMESSD